MPIIRSGKSPFQAYARLISVLGDQLISDKWVGVIELVKNCYDADAESVKVRFIDFWSKDSSKKPTIEIEDDGSGMTLDTILNVWMKPATPNKLNQKKGKEKRLTQKGRVVQWDKGVGRFAIYKLWDYVEVFTKTKETDEIKLTLNFHDYADDEFHESSHKDKFLDEILNEWEEHSIPERIFNERGHGTIIRISDVRNDWNYDDLERLSRAFFRISPPILPSVSIKEDFTINLYWNSQSYTQKHRKFEELIELSPFSFEGIVDKDGNLDSTYKHNTKKLAYQFDLLGDSDMKTKFDLGWLKEFRRFFTENPDKSIEIRRPTFWGFTFFFYAFDFLDPALQTSEKQFLKETSVYLYRDNLRVYPYWEIGDDWLWLSKSRAEIKASHFFSYNDLLWFVFITQDENPHLRDAADREGLMNINGAKEDFVAIIQAILKIMKTEVDIDKTRAEKKRMVHTMKLSANLQDTTEALKQWILASNNSELIEKSEKLFHATEKFVSKIQQDLKITQELAWTGMAIEKATHDTMSLLKKLIANTKDFVNKFNENRVSGDELKKFLIDIQESLEFLYQELQVLEPLLRVARKITKDVSVREVAGRVFKYFGRELKDGITATITSDNGNAGDVIVSTNTGLILQVILNLMDNSVYWLKQSNSSKKEIRLFLDSSSKRIIFADSGPGIDVDIIDLVFTEFYSKKVDGRGLGLYIVKELLDRIDAEISVITNPAEKVLEWANFVIQFKNQP